MTIYFKFHLELICHKHSVFSNMFSHISNLKSCTQLNLFNFGKVSICLVCNDYSFKRRDVIGCPSFYPLLLYIYCCIELQDIKQVWHQINISLLKTAFVI